MFNRRGGHVCERESERVTERKDVALHREEPAEKESGRQGSYGEKNE